MTIQTTGGRRDLCISFYKRCRTQSLVGPFQRPVHWGWMGRDGGAGDRQSIRLVAVVCAGVVDRRHAPQAHAGGSIAGPADLSPADVRCGQVLSRSVRMRAAWALNFSGTLRLTQAWSLPTCRHWTCRLRSRSPGQLPMPPYRLLQEPPTWSRTVGAVKGATQGKSGDHTIKTPAPLPGK